MFALVKCVFVLCGIAAAAASERSPWCDPVFHLFTRQNPSMSQILSPTEQSSVLASNFDSNHRTIITVHGIGDSAGGNFNAFVVPAHLAAGDVNVIAVDWSASSSVYIEGLANAVYCGSLIASFVSFLRFYGFTSEMYIVGVGMGGHLAGIAAERVFNELRHVVAIDPSLFGWTHHFGKLRPEQAELVEVLHCTAGLLGYDYPLGHLDFYPNGGTYQSSCGTDIDCSHTLCYAFYAESISAANGSRFVGTACDSYDKAISHTCDGAKDAVFGGLDDKSGQSGIYYFQTNWAPPFAQG